MAKSLKQNLEEWVIAVLAASSALAGVQILNADSSEDAEKERLIVDGNDGSKQLAGPKCYECEVTVELRSTNRDAAAVDALFAAVEAALISPDATAITDAATRFSRLEFLPENMSSSDDRSGKTRHRSRKYPFEALLN